MAMKLTTGIVAIAITMGAGAAYAQNPDAIDNARSVAKSLQQKQANDTNAALDAAGVVSQSDKPAPGAPAPAVKPAVIPDSTETETASTKPAVKAAAPSAKPVAVSESANRLQRVNVTQAADGVQVEMILNEAVTPRVTKMSSPARVLVELPETAAATSQNHIAVNNAGVKGVRIGMNGKNPPTTSVVVDLEKALTYDLAPGADGKVVLTLHTDGAAPAVAKNPVSVKAAPVAAQSKPVAQIKPAVQTKAGSETKAEPKTVAKVTAAPVVAKVAAAKENKPAKAAESKAQAKPAEAKAAAPATADAIPAETEVSKLAEAPKPKTEDKKWAMNGKRDPFFSPVVQQQGSGCSTGKKCLEIGTINLRGVVKSDNGFIAVVTNNLNKAYFLRENDPVFNGYVVRITGDSVVFQETIQDKLGKPFTREVVKRIFTPAV